MGHRVILSIPTRSCRSLSGAWGLTGLLLGCSWLLLAAPGCSWIASGCSWATQTSTRTTHLKTHLPTHEIGKLRNFKRRYLAQFWSKTRVSYTRNERTDELYNFELDSEAS